MIGPTTLSVQVCNSKFTLVSKYWVDRTYDGSRGGTIGKPISLESKYSRGTVDLGTYATQVLTYSVGTIIAFMDVAEHLGSDAPASNPETKESLSQIGLKRFNTGRRSAVTQTYR